MKRKVSPRELSEFLSTYKPKQIIYSAENQKKYDPLSSVKYECRFTAISVFWDASSVFCSDAFGNKVFFDYVNYAEIDADSLESGVTVQLHCTTIDHVVHTLLVTKM